MNLQAVDADGKGMRSYLVSRSGPAPASLTDLPHD